MIKAPERKIATGPKVMVPHVKYVRHEAPSGSPQDMQLPTKFQGIDSISFPLSFKKTILSTPFLLHAG